MLAALILVASLGALAAVLGRSPQAARGATATPTATTIPGPTATPQVFFQDPLTSNTKGWFTDSRCVVKADGLHVTDRNCITPAGRLGNVDVQVDTTIVSGSLASPCGIVLRDTSQGANRYDFDVTGNGQWAIQRYVNGYHTFLTDYQANSSIRQGLGAVNRLEARAVGTHLEFFANGSLLGQVDDSNLIDGFIGLLSNPGLETVFSNLQIGYP
ncbi:MAG TPA: hypothetical protein VJN88_05795 [Ktedonobacterales bacterium]|nr:hypothetical protein [Ktedonobacterales bacterium]